MKSRKANRGKDLESLIDATNKWYYLENIADVKKIPTPFKVLRAYEKNKALKVGHTEKGYLVDYIGISYKSTIVFDCKETSKKYLPLSSIPIHQYEMLHSWHYKGAEAFLIVHFTSEDKYFRLHFKTLERYVKGVTEGGRKSIPLSTFEKEAIELRKNLSGHLYYL